MDFMGLHDFSSEKKRFSSEKETVSHPNQLVSFQVRILQLQFRMLCSALYSYKDTGSKRPQATTVWILRKAKSSCCVFCLFGVSLYVWRHVELQGKARSETSFFSWEESRLYRLPSKCKNSDTLCSEKMPPKCS